MNGAGNRPDRGALLSVRSIVLAYVVVAGAWILVSDHLVSAWIEDPAVHDRVSTFKGCAFVLITALLLYGLMKRMTSCLEAERASARAREQQLRQLIEASPSVIYELASTDGELRPVFCSGNVERILGYSADEAMAPGWWSEHIHPEDREAALAASESLPRTGLVSHDYRFAHKGGYFMWAHDELRIVPDEAGRPHRFVGAWMDVSERRRTDEVARRWTEAFELSSLGMAIHDARDDTFVQVNQAFALQLGYPPDALRGLAVREVYAPAERKGLEGRLATVDATGQLSFESVHLCRDGTHLPVLIMMTAMRDVAGRVTSRLVYALDISARKAVEDRLRQMSQAIEQSPQSVIITNLRAEIECVNAAFEHNTGYSRDEVMGRNPRFLQSGRTPRETYADMWQALTRGESWRGELYNRRKDGREFCERAVITPVRSGGGEITHYLEFKEDVTDLKALDSELTTYREHLEDVVARRTAELAAAKQAAEVANRAKSGFLAAMSHEIRTPMNGVVGLADVLRQSDLSEYQIDLVDTMRESALSLLGIIDDVLDFSKIEAEQLELAREPVALRRLVEGVGDTLQPVAARKQVELSVFVDPGLPETIVSDELRLRQILTNLVGNAVKFSAGPDRRGRVTVRVTSATDGLLRLSVEDNGIGMGADTRERLFVPFSQGEASTTRRFGGTGLGLAICKRLVVLFRGSIDIVSEPGYGSTFIVSLPFEAVPGMAPAGGSTVLVGVHCVTVATDPGRSEDWARYLAHAGARVGQCGDLGAARAALGGNSPHPTVVVTDLAPADEPWRWVNASFGDVRAGFVIIGHGARRTPRPLFKRVVSLGGEAMHRDSLVEAVALAAGRLEQRPALETRGVAAETGVPSLDEAAAAGRLILVAEDDPVNQKVIRRQLALLGYACEVARDGAEALQRWRSGRHGLLLTDLHMPEMDGYELTAMIRSEEAEGHHLPIIAVTANALRGEDVRCKAAGLDDYLSKPVQLELLRRTLAHWLPVAPGLSGTPDGEGRPPAESMEVPTLDTNVLAALIGADPAAIDEFLQDFLASASKASSELQVASSAAEWRTVEAIAHRLKSSSRSVGALALGEICTALERAGKHADRAAIEAGLPAFENALAQVIHAVAQRSGGN